MTQQIPEETLQQIEHNFHELIRQRAGGFIENNHLELPKLEFNLNQEKHWFLIPGMYGRFGYWWEQETLTTESWCRVLKGVEFDAVIIAGLDMADEFPYDPDADFQEKAGIYTAMTRARDHLVMLYDTKNSIVDLMETALNSPDQLESEA